MAQQTEKTLEIWTDGACKCNPGIGGWGAYMVWGAHTREMYGGSKLTTNNQMELTAVISALSALRRKCPICLQSTRDVQNVVLQYGVDLNIILILAAMCNCARLFKMNSRRHLCGALAAA